MGFLALIYADLTKMPTTEAERNALFAAYESYTQSIKTDGSFVAGDPVVPMPDQVRTVRASGVTVGPEMPGPVALVGYYLLRHDTLEAACASAARIPAAAYGYIHVTPIMQM